MNVLGNQKMDQLSQELDIPFQRIGALVVCLDPAELPQLRALYDRGLANGVAGLSLLSGEEARALEPNLAEGVCGALLAGTSGSLLVLAAGMCLERKWISVMKAAAVIGQETLTILCFHMFLFMFIKTGASMLGLPSGLTKALLVFGSAGVLTAAGRAAAGILTLCRGR